MQELGKAIFVNIEDEALLDLDVLMNAHWGLVDLRLSKGILLLDGTTIHCMQITTPDKVRKIVK